MGGRGHQPTVRRGVDAPSGRPGAEVRRTRVESEAERGDVLMAVVDEMVLDASVVIDRIEELHRTTGDPFEGRLDPTRGVGYLGHSLGGAAAVWTLEREPRVRAAVSWEGQVYRETDRHLAVTGGPLLYFTGGANRAELVGTQFRPGVAGGVVHEVVIEGAWHASFGDMLYIYRRYADRGWLERHRREVPAIDLERALLDLPPRMRAALILHCIEGLPQKEVAHLMSISEGTVKAHVHRARRILKEKLDR